MTDSYLIHLAHDYLDCVSACESGLYGTEIVALLNGNRSVIHEQLLAAMGETRESEMDMVAVCRAMINL